MNSNNNESFIEVAIWYTIYIGPVRYRLPTRWPLYLTWGPNYNYNFSGPNQAIIKNEVPLDSEYCFLSRFAFLFGVYGNFEI